jgi:short-subunit dehydrogenase
MKHVLIVGATSDMAAACARQFAAKGIHLVLAGRNEEVLNRLAQELRETYPVQVRTLGFDALHFKSHPDFFRKAVDAFGSLDGVLIAHGYLGEQKRAERDWEEARKILDTNFTSVVSVANLAAAYFERKKAGFICCFSSVAGDRGRQSNYLYGSAKGGLSVYLQGLRNRLCKSGVHVLTVKPGFVATKMTAGMDGMFLVAQPERIARSLYTAIKRKRNVVYLPWFWREIMWIIKAIPEWLFKRMNL